jgi:hypothetical protein
MRRPGSTLSARIDPDDVRGRYVSSSRAPCKPPEGPQVIDDFGEVMPVTQRELDTIETYLGALLDDMLMRMGIVQEHLGTGSDRCDNESAIARCSS